MSPERSPHRFPDKKSMHTCQLFCVLITVVSKRRTGFRSKVSVGDHCVNTVSETLTGPLTTKQYSYSVSLVLAFCL